MKCTRNRVQWRILRKTPNKYNNSFSSVTQNLLEVSIYETSSAYEGYIFVKNVFLCSTHFSTNLNNDIYFRLLTVINPPKIWKNICKEMKNEYWFLFIFTDSFKMTRNIAWMLVVSRSNCFKIYLANFSKVFPKIMWKYTMTLSL